LAAGAAKPRRGRANITCWTCDKVGHYSFECEKGERSEDETKSDVKLTNHAAVAIVESDDECGGAWAAEAVDDEPDWFEMAVAMDHDGKTVAENLHEGLV
jgi:hypothetical protein